MKKFLCIILALSMILALASCSKTTDSETETAQDDSPVTMLVSLGNGEAYYEKIKELVKRDLDIDIEFVYQLSADTTNMTKLYFINHDLPADIIFTASKLDDDLVKDCCVDILSRSSLASYFTPVTVNNCTTEDGAIYQLPLSSKLIGITYNETLLNEMGWEVPETFDDMVDLKEKCLDAGIKFAVCDGAATGHGFNWLFHLMGAQWLSTPEGTEWFEDFQSGKATIEEFKEKCSYFKKWTEAGLWGDVHNIDWNGSTEFSQTRALFWYGLTNSVSGYEGPLYDEEGNPTDVMLNDTYKTIPWISEDGSNNCYTYYDNSWVYVNKELENNKEKLEKVFKVLEYMVSGEATNVVTEISKDTYVSVNNYKIGDDRLYARYNENITNGFVSPWYYNSFDVDSIVNVGDAVNKYILNAVEFDDIFTILDEYNQKNINKDVAYLAEFPDGLGYEDTAKLAAIGIGNAVQMTIEENGRDEKVDAVLCPYTPEDNLIQPFRTVSVSSAKVYPGKLDKSYAQTVIPITCTTLYGVYLTGTEINELLNNKYDPSDWFIDAETGESTFDSENYGPYPYVCLTKDNAEIDADKEYLVAIADRFLTSAKFEELKANGKVLELQNTHQASDGVIKFGEEHPTITSKDLVW